MRKARGSTPRRSRGRPDLVSFHSSLLDSLVDRTLTISLLVPFPASPSSILAAIPAAIASVVPAAIVPAALSGESHEEPKEIQETPSVPVDSFNMAATTPAVEEPLITNKEGEKHSTVAEMATGAVAAAVAGAGAVVAGATDMFSGDDADKDEPAEAHPAETAAQEDPIAGPVVSATTLDEADDDDDDSSDDGNEGPEDLDAQPSYSARKELGTDDTSTTGGESLSRQASSHLASTASAFGSFESTAPASDPFESAEEPVVAAAGVPLPISPAVEEPHALNAPFPPAPVDSDRQPTTTAFDDSFGDSTADFNTFDTDFQPVPIASAASTTANNPFFASAPPAADTQEKTFDESSPFEPTPSTPPATASTPQPPAAPPLPSAPAAAFSAPPPIPSRPDQAQSQPAHAAFDDAFGNDDFETFDADFEPVPVAKSPVGGAAPSNNPFSTGAGESAVKPVYDFDPSFADFDTAFDDARPAHGQTGQSAAPTDFDDAFGSTPFAPTTSAPDQSASSVGQHAFDDAFGESEPAFGGAQEQSQYAPPAGPPPGQQPQIDRPSLPSRPTNTAAEPDDIPDVKKIVAMGFSRSQALNALEVRFLPHVLLDVLTDADPTSHVFLLRSATTTCKRPSTTSFRAHEDPYCPLTLVLFCFSSSRVRLSPLFSERVFGPLGSSRWIFTTLLPYANASLSLPRAPFTERKIVRSGRQDIQPFSLPSSCPETHQPRPPPDRDRPTYRPLSATGSSQPGRVDEPRRGTLVPSRVCLHPGRAASLAMLRRPWSPPRPRSRRSPQRDRQIRSTRTRWRRESEGDACGQGNPLVRGEGARSVRAKVQQDSKTDGLEPRDPRGGRRETLLD